MIYLCFDNTNCNDRSFASAKDMWVYGEVTLPIMIKRKTRFEVKKEKILLTIAQPVSTEDANTKMSYR